MKDQDADDVAFLCLRIAQLDLHLRLGSNGRDFAWICVRLVSICLTLVLAPVVIVALAPAVQFQHQHLLVHLHDGAALAYIEVAHDRVRDQRNAGNNLFDELGRADRVTLRFGHQELRLELDEVRGMSLHIVLQLLATMFP